MRYTTMVMNLFGALCMEQSVHLVQTVTVFLSYVCFLRPHSCFIEARRFFGWMWFEAPVRRALRCRLYGMQL